LSNLTAQYLHDFVYEKLDLSSSHGSRHASRTICLCQYAESKDHILTQELV